VSCHRTASPEAALCHLPALCSMLRLHPVSCLPHGSTLCQPRAEGDSPYVTPRFRLYSIPMPDGVGWWLLPFHARMQIEQWLLRGHSPLGQLLGQLLGRVLPLAGGPGLFTSSGSSSSRSGSSHGISCGGRGSSSSSTTLPVTNRPPATGQRTTSSDTGNSSGGTSGGSFSDSDLDEWVAQREAAAGKLWEQRFQLRRAPNSRIRRMASERRIRGR